YQGYKQAMEEANLEINPKWIVESNFECDGGFDSYQALKAGGQMPSALFVSNDMMAMGVIHAAAQDGTLIPHDL
ncbi:substrate-binding domain-containing protein, partial [Vibrio sp. 10N.286.51.F4]